MGLHFNPFLALASLPNFSLSRPSYGIIFNLTSGSASRSMFGGFVKWQKGEKSDGSDSIAVQIADEKVPRLHPSPSRLRQYSLQYFLTVLARNACCGVGS